MGHLFADRRVLIGVVAAGLVVVAIALWALLRPGATEASPQGAGLVVQTGRDDDIKSDPAHPIRCFVGGQMVGELTIAECARRNGVEPGSMDVGLDANGVAASATPPVNPKADPKAEAIDTSTDDKEKPSKPVKPPEE